MSLARALAQATALELAVVAALGGLAGAVGGLLSPWLDLLNIAAPLWLALGAAGAILGLRSLGKGRVRTAVVALAAAGALAGGVRMAFEAGALVSAALAPAPAPAELSLLSHNVWRANRTIDATIDMILSEDADVVALQEVGGPDGAWTRLETRYPYRGECRRQHSLLLSKLPITASHCETMPAKDGAALRLAWASLRMADGAEATVASTHLTWPSPPAAQTAAWRGLTGALKRFAPERLVLVGDFNSVPWTYAMGRHDAALQPLRRRTRALSTWPANFVGLRPPWVGAILPIDHIYAGPAWRRVKVRRGRPAGSDHYPLIAILGR